MELQMFDSGAHSLEIQRLNEVIRVLMENINFKDEEIRVLKDEVYELRQRRN